MGCSSQKVATLYLQQFQFLSNCLSGPVRNIASSLYSMLNEYCKQDSDKEGYSEFVLQDISELGDFIEGKY